MIGTKAATAENVYVEKKTLSASQGPSPTAELESGAKQLLLTAYIKLICAATLQLLNF